MPEGPGGLGPPPSGALAALVHAALARRGVVIALAGLLLAYAAWLLPQATYDVFPEFAPPVVTIQTEAPGLAPEQVEVLVTQPIENAVGGLPGIAALRSSSVQGLSVVTITFEAHGAVTAHRQAVAERLAALAAQWPRGVRAPAITPLTSSTSTVLAIGLTSARVSPMALRTAADWTVRPRLLAVPGVAKVAVFGGEVRQLQVQVDPERLVRHDLSIEDVLAAARRAAATLGAGFIDGPNQRLVLQTAAPAASAERLAATVLLRAGGASLTLGDVATVVEAPAPAVGAAAIDGVPGVQLLVSQQFGGNTLAVTRRVEQALAELAPALAAQGIELHPALLRPADFVEVALANVRSALLAGAALVVLVLVAFLGDARAAAISLAAIPLSLLAAIVVLHHAGASLDTMTLGGLAIAVGLVVDDAVIDVENIHRRLRERAAGATAVAAGAALRRRDAAAVVLDAVLQVRAPVVFATLAVALVFVPVLALSGVAGRLFGPLALAYVLATLASLVVAMTVTPALCLALLPRGGPRAAREPPLVRVLRRGYERLLARLQPRAGTVAAAALLLTAASLAALPRLAGEFLPELRESHFTLHMAAVPGTSLQESLRLGAQVTQALHALPFVRSVAQRAGRAEQADDVSGTHYSEFEVALAPLSAGQAEDAADAIRRALAPIPGAGFAVKTFLTERIEETLSGYTAQVVASVYGRDLDALDRQAQAVARVLARVPGAADVQLPAPPGAPALVVRLREPELARWGLDPLAVHQALHVAFQGDVAGQVQDGNRVIDVVVLLEPAARRSLHDVAALPLRAPGGEQLRLADVAQVWQGAGRSAVLHAAGQRVQTVTCNVVGRDVDAFVEEARQRLAAEVPLAAGSHLELGGTAQAQARARRDLLVHAALAAVAIVALLSMATGARRNLVLLLANLPFALAGGVLALLAAGGTLSLGALVGFVTLFGITLRNAILMLAHYEHLVGVEGIAWGPGAAVRGASERLAAILMTSLATAMGLLPLALGSGAPGREIEGPMAVVILGGLATSTLLNLLVLPLLALRFGSFERIDRQ